MTFSPSPTNYPYGGELPITSGDPNKYKFVDKERDTESTLDMLGASLLCKHNGPIHVPRPSGVQRGLSSGRPAVMEWICMRETILLD